MGFVKRYWKEAEEKNIPHWHTCVIVEMKTGEARVQRRGLRNIPSGFMPECPKTFATYEEAFAWLERKLTKYAPDVAPVTSAEPDSGLESIPAVESDTQPRG